MLISTFFHIIQFQNDGELTDLPSPTTSEFLRKWADEDGDDFDLQDAEQYLNPTAEELTGIANHPQGCLMLIIGLCSHTVGVNTVVVVVKMCCSN